MTRKINTQLSFLNESGNVRVDCVCGSVPCCYICNEPIPRSCLRTKYFLACGKPRRICEFCYVNYRKSFDIGVTRRKSKKSKKGGKLCM